jgi:hypothetical protein
LRLVVRAGAGGISLGQLGQGRYAVAEQVHGDTDRAGSLHPGRRGGLLASPGPPEDHRRDGRRGRRGQGQALGLVEGPDRQGPEEQAQDQVDLEEHAAAQDEGGQRAPPGQPR